MKLGLLTGNALVTMTKTYCILQQEGQESIRCYKEGGRERKKENTLWVICKEGKQKCANMYMNERENWKKNDLNLKKM